MSVFALGAARSWPLNSNPCQTNGGREETCHGNAKSTRHSKLKVQSSKLTGSSNGQAPRLTRTLGRRRCASRTGASPTREFSPSPFLELVGCWLGAFLSFEPLNFEL